MIEDVVSSLTVSPYDDVQQQCTTYTCAHVAQDTGKYTVLPLTCEMSVSPTPILGSLEK